MTARATVVRALVAVACGLAAAVAWIHARDPGDDDRSQIIVRSGSIIIENGGVLSGSGSGQTTAWSHDGFLSEWKPDDNNFYGISGFTVSFEGAYASCGDTARSPSPVTIAAMTGDDVLIDFSYSKVVRGSARPQASSVHFHLRGNHGLGLWGKKEPKLDDLGFTDTSSQPPPAPQQLLFPLPGDAYISRVQVTGNAVCKLPPPPDLTTGRAFHVLIQPKKDPAQTP